MIETKSTTEAEKVTHTAGPWKWGRGVDDDETRCFVTQGIPGEPEYLIAEIQNGAPGDCLETEVANARLIAAAPDLLEACKELRCAVAAAMRVISRGREMTDAFVNELARAGVADGFGVRSGDVIERAEGRE